MRLTPVIAAEMKVAAAMSRSAALELYVKNTEFNNFNSNYGDGALNEQQ